MDIPYFVFKGISSKDFDIIINALPDHERAAERVVKTEISGRDGHLIESLGAYDSVLKSVECTVMPDANIEALSDWLRGGGDVIFSNDPDRAYQAHIINAIPFNRVARILKGFVIQFDCQPFKMSTYTVKESVTVSGTKVMNYGTREAKPIIKVNGSGDVTLTINNENIILDDIDGYVTIDSVLMDAYKGDLLKNNKMLGEFPKLKVGANLITWVGAVTSVEISFREMYY